MAGVRIRRGCWAQFEDRFPSDCWVSVLSAIWASLFVAFCLDLPGNALVLEQVNMYKLHRATQYSFAKHIRTQRSGQIGCNMTVIACRPLPTACANMFRAEATCIIPGAYPTQPGKAIKSSIERCGEAEQVREALGDGPAG